MASEGSKTLQRVQQNDPTLTRLHVIPGLPGTADPRAARDRGRSGLHWTYTDSDLSRLGNGIAGNEYLQKMIISNAESFSDRGEEAYVDFIEGLKSNASISRMGLLDSNLLETRNFSDLVSAAICNIRSFTLMDCTLGSAEVSAVTLAASTNTSLRRISLVRCGIDDEIVTRFISEIHGLHHLKRVDLLGNNIGRAGFESIASMLRDPNCSLEGLDLGGIIDDACLSLLASSLKGNTKLRVLGSRTPATAALWDIFAKILCDTSTVNSTFFSNHTLESLTFETEVETDFIGSLLQMNRHTDKKRVATQKVLRCHPNIDMQAFLEWDLKVLPFAISWFDRAREYNEAVGEIMDVDSRKLSSIYQFVRFLPLMFLPPPIKAGMKRKANDIHMS